MALSVKNLQLHYLASKGLSKETASDATLSNAKAYETCYNWYISTQHVLPETADLASDVWVSKYALHDANGICLEFTPEDMWHRIAKSLAKIEMQTNLKSTKSEQDWEEIFYCNLQNFKGVPGGSALSVLGNDFINSSVSNCFVVGTEDSLEGIMKTASDMARIQSYRGGTGIDITTLRPAKSPVHNSAKYSTGAVSFMDFFSKVTSTIGQSGRSGATMITLSSHHPDIMAFIDEKQDLDKQWFFNELQEAGIYIDDHKHTAIASRLKSTTKANVSIKADDAFMKAVETDSDYELYYDFKDNKYPRISETVKARDIWNKFISANTKSAEPGLLFWDTIIKESVSDCYAGKKEYSITMNGVTETVEHDVTTTATNPCAELPLPIGSACTLMSQNLTQYVKNAWTTKSAFDFEAFTHDVRISTRMLDNIKEYDISKLPLKINQIDAILCRRIGLGCHGLADALLALGYKYDTPEAINMASEIYKILSNTVYDESVTLAIEKGTFPIWDWELEKNNPFLNRLNKEVQDRIKKHGRRNIACLTSAPTGSLSIISRNCSSGIEPVFKKEYLRNVKKQGSEETIQYKVYHQAIQDCLDMENHIDINPICVEASEINWEHRVKMQSAIQRYIDHSISSTINLPAETPEEVVSNIYLTAWKAGLKGITIYVEGSRTGVLVSSESDKKDTKILERPKTTNVRIHKTKYKDKNYMILIGLVDDKPIEVFGGLEEGLSLPTIYHSATLTKKSRGHYSLNVQLSEDEEDILKVNNIAARFPAFDVVALTRMISLSLKNNIPISDIVDQLSKSATSLYDAPAVFARVLKTYITDEEAIAKEQSKGDVCPDCGSDIIIKRENGCIVKLCSNCSYMDSKCS